jgi:hypothetical protein
MRVLLANKKLQTKNGKQMTGRFFLPNGLELTGISSFREEWLLPPHIDEYRTETSYCAELTLHCNWQIDLINEEDMAAHAARYLFIREKLGGAEIDKLLDEGLSALK